MEPPGAGGGGGASGAGAPTKSIAKRRWSSATTKVQVTNIIARPTTLSKRQLMERQRSLRMGGGKEGEEKKGAEEEDEEDEDMTAEEKEEEEQDKAVRHIQALFRQRKAKKLVRELVEANFIKEWDASRQAYCYIDKRFGRKQWTKPRCLGDDDLPAPRPYRAPPGHVPQQSSMRQFALISHSAEFEDFRIPSLPRASVKAEHEGLRQAMFNPFTAGFSARDCMFVFEPTRDAFQMSLESMQRVCTKHILSEEEKLMDRFRSRLRENLDALFGMDDPLPSWAQVASGGSLLVTTSAWTEMDLLPVVLSQPPAPPPSADPSASSSGGDKKRKDNDEAEEEGGKGKGGKKKTGKGADDADLIVDVKFERRRIFEEWANDVTTWRGAHPEEWEAELQAMQEAKEAAEAALKEKDVNVSREELIAMQLLRSQNAGKRPGSAFDRRRQQEEDHGGIRDIYDLMGGTLDPLRDKNASADRLLSLIESGNSLQAQTRLALLLQKRYRGWKARMLVAEKRAEMEENRLRDEASSKADAARRYAEEEAAAEARQRLAMLRAGSGGNDKSPMVYGWDRLYPTNVQRDLGMQAASVVIYVSAYVGRIKRGKHKGGYFLFSDSSFRNQEQILRTGYKVDDFAEAVRTLPFRERLIILNVVHSPYPSDDSTFRNRCLYPPADLYASLAEKAQAVVFGSCLLGGPLSSSALPSPPTSSQPPGPPVKPVETRRRRRSSADDDSLESRSSADSTAVVPGGSKKGGVWGAFSSLVSGKLEEPVWPLDDPGAVEISGAVGTIAHLVNGTFTSTGEYYGGKVLFRRVIEEADFPDEDDDMMGGAGAPGSPAKPGGGGGGGGGKSAGKNKGKGAKKSKGKKGGKDKEEEEEENREFWLWFDRISRQWRISASRDRMDGSDEGCARCLERDLDYPWLAKDQSIGGVARAGWEMREIKAPPKGGARAGATGAAAGAGKPEVWQWTPVKGILCEKMVLHKHHVMEDDIHFLAKLKLEKEKRKRKEAEKERKHQKRLAESKRIQDSMNQGKHGVSFILPKPKGKSAKVSTGGKDDDPPTPKPDAKLKKVNHSFTNSTQKSRSFCEYSRFRPPSAAQHSANPQDQDAETVRSNSTAGQHSSKQGEKGQQAWEHEEYEGERWKVEGGSIFGLALISALQGGATGFRDTPGDTNAVAGNVQSWAATGAGGPAGSELELGLGMIPMTQVHAHIAEVVSLESAALIKDKRATPTLDAAAAAAAATVVVSSANKSGAGTAGDAAATGQSEAAATAAAAAEAAAALGDNEDSLDERALAIKEYKRKVVPTGQHPVLWSYHPLLEVSSKFCNFPTPPPQPGQPTATQVNYRSIRLNWDEPEFDGDAIIRYELEAREFTRLTSRWHRICVWSKIQRPLMHVPHLVPGVTIQFRVRACNHGGWGLTSEESVFLMAGADQQPHTVEEQLTAMALYGPRKLVTTLSAHDKEEAVQCLGLLQLSGLCMHMRTPEHPANALGRPSVAKGCVEAALHAMQTFPWQRLIQLRGCLILARLFRHHGPWLQEFARAGEADRLERFRRFLATGEDEEDAGKKKEEASTSPGGSSVASSSSGGCDAMLSLAAVQLRFDRRDIALTSAVDEVLSAMNFDGAVVV